MPISNEDGLVKLTVIKNGQEHSATCDLYEAVDDLTDIKPPAQDADSKTVGEFWDAVQAWAVSIGLPQLLTRYALNELRKAVFKASADLAKKGQQPESSETPG